uniref:NACHT LRR and PYD domain-containing protein n=1 Tax=Sinocyclocheilus grahami TaxID=75366 RepID=A0A672SSZ3_SINGR
KYLDRFLQILYEIFAFIIYRLSDCSITEESYKTLTSALASNSHLIELDLRGNDPGQSGVKVIMDFLQSGWFKLKNIRLNNIKLKKKSCLVLATVLSKNNTLKEMDLSKSLLLDSGVKEICEGLKKPECKLKILKLCDCGLTEESCSALATVLRSNPSLKELDMSNNNLQDSGVKKLQKGLENSKVKHCLILVITFSFRFGYNTLHSNCILVTFPGNAVM